MANIADLLSQSVELHADHIAIKVDERRLSYAELDRAAAQVAGLLAPRAYNRETASGSCCPTSRTLPSVTTVHFASAPRSCR